ncbi:hypothetical protein BaRGS_00032889 [Batillaria attramentaria]|uniref:Uncharacterized protein n=1 Tax=Batillaria attramentaria TaxID=370345 RepID=A0ABD0JLX3_9CAEN
MKILIRTNLGLLWEGSVANTLIPHILHNVRISHPGDSRSETRLRVSWRLALATPDDVNNVTVVPCPPAYGETHLDHHPSLPSPPPPSLRVLRVAVLKR